MLDAEALADLVAELVADEVEKATTPLAQRIAELEARPAPEKGDEGKSVTLDELRPVISEALDAAVKAMPVPKDGEPGKDAANIVEALKDSGELVLTLADGRLIRTGIRDGEKGADGKDGKDGADGKDGSDGAGIADVLRDHEGNLVFTFTDGRMKALGNVNGKDGEPGKDGRDGFDLTSFDAIVLDDDRTVEFKFVSGDEERVASFKWPTILDRGVYKAGETYEPGDAVTWGGSLWIAQRATDAKPDTPDSGFRLAVKRGRDGKDAKVG
jgi:integrin beta 3